MKGRVSTQPNKMFKTSQFKPARKNNPYPTPFNKNVQSRISTNRPNFIKKPIDVRNRLGTRSIQEIYKGNPQNQRDGGYKTEQNQEEDGLFAQSHKKIGLIKQTFGTNKLIEFELSEVLKLIKEQKNKIHETISELRQASDYYQSLCEFKAANKNNAFVNTQIILHRDNAEYDFSTQQAQTNKQEDRVTLNHKENQQQKSIKYIGSQSIEMIECQTQINISGNKQMNDQQIQTDDITNRSGLKEIVYKKWTAERYTQTEVEEVVEQKKQAKIQQKVLQHIIQHQISKQENQVYKKLVSMLSEMNIDYKQILPEQVEVQVQAKNWKNLSEVQIIKIQKYFIKKLAQKIPQ